MLILPPVLTHAVAAEFVGDLKQALVSEPVQVVVDASALREFDSSALAVLLECRRQALTANKGFSVQGLSTRLRQLADLYGVAELIPAAA